MTFISAAVIASARSDVVDDFTQAAAFSPTSAILYTPRRGLQERWFSRLQEEGVIKAVSAGRFYLDQMESARSQKRRRSVKISVLAGLGAILAAVLLLG